MARAMGPSKKTSGAKTEKEEYFVCPHCGRSKKRGDFYQSTDPAVVIGVAFPCKDCAEKIARNYNPRFKTYGDCTEQSVQAALEYLDKPFLKKIYDSSCGERDGGTMKTVWAAYIKNITSLGQYRTLRWRDGDLFKDAIDVVVPVETTKEINIEVMDELEKNRRDIIRLIGYDPFEKEADEDKPLLYAQLIGYIDSEGNNDDMTRVLDSIEIVRGYLQLQKINDMSAKAFAHLGATGQAGEIKNYMDTKKRIADVISQLAEQSCISLKHNKNASKGENTWTGKIKKLKELNLREAEVNGFDMGTCRGMQQVLEMSDASIMKQLNLDESEWSDMVAEQRAMIVKLQNERDVYREINRLLLRENLDLRDVLDENDLLDIENLQNLKDLFSSFGEIEIEDDEEEEDEDE